MATCQKCFKQIPEEANRCPFCGVAVEAPAAKPKKTMFGFAPAMPPKPVAPRLDPQAPQTVKSVTPPEQAQPSDKRQPKSVAPSSRQAPSAPRPAEPPQPVQPKSVVPRAIARGSTVPGGTAPPAGPASTTKPKSVMPPATETQPDETPSPGAASQVPAPTHQQILLPRGGKANIDDRAKTMVPGALPAVPPKVDPQTHRISSKEMMAAAVGIPLDAGPTAEGQLQAVDSDAKTLAPGMAGANALLDAKTMDPTNAMEEQLSLAEKPPVLAPSDQALATAPTITPATGVPVVTASAAAVMPPVAAPSAPAVTPPPVAAPVAPPVAAPVAPPVAAPVAPPVAAPVSPPATASASPSHRVASPVTAAPAGSPAVASTASRELELGSVPTIPSGLPGLKLHEDEHLIAVETPSNLFWMLALLGLLLVVTIPFAIWLLLRAGRAYVLTNRRAVRVGRNGVEELAHDQLAECRPSSFMGIADASVELVPRDGDRPALEFTFCGPREAAARLQGMLRFWLADAVEIDNAPQVDLRNRIREPVFDLDLVLIPGTRCRTAGGPLAGLLAMTPERLIWLPEQPDHEDRAAAIVPVTAFSHSLARCCETIDAFEQELLRVGQTGLLAVSLARRWDVLSELRYDRGKGLSFIDGESDRRLTIFVPSDHETTVRAYLAKLGLPRPPA